MKSTSIKNKALAAAVLLSFFSVTAAFAVENRPKTQEECVGFVEVCYDTWYIPDFVCNSAYKDCMKDAV